MAIIHQVLRSEGKHFAHPFDPFGRSGTASLAPASLPHRAHKTPSLRICHCLLTRCCAMLSPSCSGAQVPVDTIVETMVCATRSSPAALPGASPIENAVADGACDFAQSRKTRSADGCARRMCTGAGALDGGPCPTRPGARASHATAGGEPRVVAVSTAKVGDFTHFTRAQCK